MKCMYFHLALKSFQSHSRCRTYGKINPSFRTSLVHVSQFGNLLDPPQPLCQMATRSQTLLLVLCCRFNHENGSDVRDCQISLASVKHIFRTELDRSFVESIVVRCLSCFCVVCPTQLKRVSKGVRECRKSPFRRRSGDSPQGTEEDTSTKKVD